MMRRSVLAPSPASGLPNTIRGLSFDLSSIDIVLLEQFGENVIRAIRINPRQFGGMQECVPPMLSRLTNYEGVAGNRIPLPSCNATLRTSRTHRGNFLRQNLSVVVCPAFLVGISSRNYRIQIRRKARGPKAIGGRKQEAMALAGMVLPHSIQFDRAARAACRVRILPDYTAAVRTVRQLERDG
jgi:hypothetical protein